GLDYEKLYHEVPSLLKKSGVQEKSFYRTIQKYLTLYRQQPQPKRRLYASENRSHPVPAHAGDLLLALKLYYHRNHSAETPGFSRGRKPRLFLSTLEKCERLYYSGRHETDCAGQASAQTRAN